MTFWIWGREYTNVRSTRLRNGQARLQVIDAIMDLAPIERIAEKSGVSYDTVKTLVRRWRFPQPQK